MSIVTLSNVMVGIFTLSIVTLSLSKGCRSLLPCYPEPVEGSKGEYEAVHLRQLLKKFFNKQYRHFIIQFLFLSEQCNPIIHPNISTTNVFPTFV